MNCSPTGSFGSRAAARGHWHGSTRLSSIFSITTWCRRRSTPRASARLRFPCRDRRIPTTGRFCYSAQPAAARRRWCGRSSVAILGANDSPRPPLHGHLSPIWRLFSVRDHSGPLLLFFRGMKCATISRNPCPRRRWPPMTAIPTRRSCEGY